MTNIIRIIVGFLLGLILAECGVYYFMWQYWVIMIPTVILLEVLYSRYE